MRVSFLSSTFMIFRRVWWNCHRLCIWRSQIEARETGNARRVNLQKSRYTFAQCPRAVRQELAHTLKGITLNKVVIMFLNQYTDLETVCSRWISDPEIMSICVCVFQKFLSTSWVTWLVLIHNDSVGKRYGALPSFLAHFTNYKTIWSRNWKSRGAKVYRRNPKGITILYSYVRWFWPISKRLEVLVLWEYCNWIGYYAILGK